MQGRDVSAVGIIVQIINSSTYYWAHKCIQWTKWSLHWCAWFDIEGRCTQNADVEMIEYSPLHWSLLILVRFFPGWHTSRPSSPWCTCFTNRSRVRGMGKRETPIFKEHFMNESVEEICYHMCIKVWEQRVHWKATFACCIALFHLYCIAIPGVYLWEGSRLTDYLNLLVCFKSSLASCTIM